jgi:cysteinyl-tRNA synthetase
MHMGHLSISGSKMSKSLKNFTTIREALSRKGGWTPRGLRIVFLLGGWKEGVEITDELVKAGIAWEDKVTNFMLKAKDLERTTLSANGTSGGTSGSNDSVLLEKLNEAEKNLDAALCDSFNTPIAMRVVSDLITDYNSLPAASLTEEPVLKVARWITRIVTIFGLDGNASLNDSKRIGWSGVEIPSSAQPFIYPLSRLRDEVRKQARSKDLSYSSIKDLATQEIVPKTADAEAAPYAKVTSDFQSEVKGLAEKEAPAKEFLALCDLLRDTRLWELDIYLEDRDPPLGAMVRPVDKQLKVARDEKEEREKAKAAVKAKREQEEAEKKKLLEEKAKSPHTEMFKTSEFSSWDDEGLPTKDAKGEEVSKAKMKKLKKEWEKQKKVHEDWAKGVGKS